MTPAISAQSPLSARSPSSTRPASSKTTAVTPGSRSSPRPTSLRKVLMYGEIGMPDKIVLINQRTDLLRDEPQEVRQVGFVDRRLQDDRVDAGVRPAPDTLGDR